MVAAVTLWVRAGLGRMVPLDAEPDEGGVWQVADGYAVQLGTSLLAAPARYRLHIHATRAQ